MRQKNPDDYGGREVWVGIEGGRGKIIQSLKRTQALQNLFLCGVDVCGGGVARGLLHCNSCHHIYMYINKYIYVHSYINT